MSSVESSDKDKTLELSDGTWSLSTLSGSVALCVGIPDCRVSLAVRMDLSSLMDWPRFVQDGSNWLVKSMMDSTSLVKYVLKTLRPLMPAISDLRSRRRATETPAGGRGGAALSRFFNGKGSDVSGRHERVGARSGVLPGDCHVFVDEFQQFGNVNDTYSLLRGALWSRCVAPISLLVLVVISQGM